MGTAYEAVKRLREKRRAEGRCVACGQVKGERRAKEMPTGEEGVWRPMGHEEYRRRANEGARQRKLKKEEAKGKDEFCEHGARALCSRAGCR